MKHFITRDCFGINFGVCKSRYIVNLQKGLKVIPVPDHEGMYWLDEFPVNNGQVFTSFPIDSFIRHDAVHYGIKLNSSQVEEL